MKARLIEFIIREIDRCSARRYKIKFELLDEESLREMIRFMRDLEMDRQMMMRPRSVPWR